MNAQRIRPRKALGQHFLKSHRIAERIIRALSPSPQNYILEIGPGTGMLTQHLILYPHRKLYAVDIDRTCIEYLEALPAIQKSNVQLLHQDILHCRLSTLAPEYQGRWKIVGNLPYYLSTEILFWLYDQAAAIEAAVIMLQREVAHRLIARPGTKSYGILSIATQCYAQATLCFNLPPSAFFPPPKVSSTVIKLQFWREPKINYVEIQNLVRIVFQFRRKTLRNALEKYIQQRYNQSLRQHEENLPEGIHTFLGKRPEQLSAEEYLFLATELERYYRGSEAEGTGTAANI